MNYAPLNIAEASQLERFGHLIADWVVDLGRQQDVEDYRNKANCIGSLNSKRLSASRRIGNLLKLGRGLYLTPPPEERFSMRTILEDYKERLRDIGTCDYIDRDFYSKEENCGTVGCMIGWMPFYDGPKKEGVGWQTYRNLNFFGFHSDQRLHDGTLTGCCDWNLWYDSDWANFTPTPKANAARLLWSLSMPFEHVQRMMDSKELAGNEETDWSFDFDFDPAILSPDLEPFWLASAVLKERVLAS